MKPENINLLLQKKPAWIWERFKFKGQEVHWLTFKIDYGFDFVLERISFKNLEDNVPNGAGDKYNLLRLELFKTIKGRTLQNKPILLRQVSTPGEGGVNYWAAPNPVDGDALNICATATPIKDLIKINEPYIYNDVVQCRFSWLTPTMWDTPCDVVLMGYYIPENTLKMWM